MREGDDTLHYLKESYKWLNNRANEVGPTIRRYASEKLFLNVNDPTSDPWKMTSASNMAFENHDVLTIERVCDFLLPYKDLLKAAGVIDVEYPKFNTRPTPENSEEGFLKRIRDGLAGMRESNTFTDVAFTSEDDAELAEEERPVFYAHRTFLYVFSEYFKTLFAGPYAEASGQASAVNPLRISLAHSRFAIKTSLGALNLFKSVSPIRPTLISF